MNEAKIITVVLGKEFDSELQKRLVAALRRRGALITANNCAVAGSQEIVTLTTEICGAEIVVEAETYIGLTLTGPEQIVHEIESELRSIELPKI